jgi:hypothetical protein
MSKPQFPAPPDVTDGRRHPMPTAAGGLARSSSQHGMPTAARTALPRTCLPPPEQAAAANAGHARPAPRFNKPVPFQPRGRPSPPRALTGRGSLNKSGIKGLVSADRSNKATLPRTTPRSTTKSYAKDLSPSICQIAIRELGARVFPKAPEARLLRYEGRALFVFSLHVRG